MDAIDREIRVGRRFWFPPDEIHRPIVIRYDAHPLGTPACDARSSRSNATRDRWTRSIDSIDSTRWTRSIDAIDRSHPTVRRRASRSALFRTPHAPRRAKFSTSRTVRARITELCVQRFVSSPSPFHAPRSVVQGCVPFARLIRARIRGRSIGSRFPRTTTTTTRRRELNASPPRESDDDAKV